MNIIPWRRRTYGAPAVVDFENFWDRLWGGGGTDGLTDLPDVFHDRPFPAVNIAETEGEFRVTMDCPGLEEKDFQIEAMGNQLLISGERSWENEKKGKEFRRVESRYGRFERTVHLPDNARIDPTEIDASYKNGVLTISVPKLERTPASKIAVHAG